MKSRSTGAKKRCDVLFSRLIRSRGACANCGTGFKLQCAHIVSRRYANTRCVPENALCLCAGCHMHFTNWPLEFAAYMELNHPGRYDAMRELALSGAKVDWEIVEAELKLKLAEAA